MAIPDFQTVMLPFLQVVANGAEHTLRDVVEQLADHFKLSEAERERNYCPAGRSSPLRIEWVGRELI